MIFKPNGSLRPNRLLKWICVYLLIALAANGCHKRKISAGKPLPSPVPMAITLNNLPDEEMTGLASWYGHPYHGRRTSSGETYNMHSMTAAHRILPYNTMVRVHNLQNGKQVQVRINDRGPFVEGRVIDLSYAAAQAIDLVESGTARVHLQIMQNAVNYSPLAIQAGSFRIYDNAVKLKEELEMLFSTVFITEFESTDGNFFRVMVGGFSDYISAMEALQELKKKRFDVFITRRDF